MRNLRRLLYFCLAIVLFCLFEMLAFCTRYAFASDVSDKARANLEVSVQATPCLRLEGSRWKIVKDSECGQVTRDWLLRNNKALLKLQFYKEVYEPKTREEKKSFAQIEKIWKEQLAACDKQKDHQQAISLQYRGMAEQWESSFAKLKKQKVPPKSWLEHPALWFTLGAVTAVALVVSSVALYNTLRGNLVATPNPLRIHSVGYRSFQVGQQRATTVQGRLERPQRLYASP